MAAMGEFAVLRQGCKNCKPQHSGMPGRISGAQYSTVCGKDQPPDAIYIPGVSPGGGHRFGAGTAREMDVAGEPPRRLVETARNRCHRSAHPTVAHYYRHRCVACLTRSHRRGDSLTELPDAGLHTSGPGDELCERGKLAGLG